MRQSILFSTNMNIFRCYILFAVFFTFAMHCPVNAQSIDDPVAEFPAPESPDNRFKAGNAPLSANIQTYAVDGLYVQVDWRPEILDELIAKQQDICKAELLQMRRDLRVKLLEIFSERSIAYEREYAELTNAQRSKILEYEKKMFRKRGITDYPALEYFYEWQPDANDLSKWDKTKPLPEVDKYMLRDFRKKLEEAYRKTCPEPSDAELESKVNDLCPLYHRGDKVSITVNGKKIQGKFRTINSLRLFIGPHIIDRRDLTQETAAMFDEELNSSRRAEILATLSQEDKESCQHFISTWEKFLLRDYLYAQGYVPARYLLEDTMEYMDATRLRWVSRHDFIDERFAENCEEKLEAFKESMPQIIRSKLENAKNEGIYHEDFQYFPPLQQWFPVSVISTIKGQIAQQKKQIAEQIAEQKKREYELKKQIAEQIAEQKKREDERNLELAKAARARAEAERARELSKLRVFGIDFTENDVWNFITNEVLTLMLVGEYPVELWENPNRVSRITGLDDPNTWTKKYIRQVGMGDEKGRVVAVCAHVGAITSSEGKIFNNLIFKVICKDGEFKVRDMKLD